MFKTINHIDDIWPFVQDIEGITLNVKEDEGFQVINYQFVTADTFLVPEALEARGIKFDLDGNIIARPFHKFFNLNEKQTASELDWNDVIDIQEKHDGSMIHPCIVNGEMRLMTRAGLSDQAKQAEDECLTLGAEAKRLLEEMLSLIEQGKTPLYEYVSPNNRIVVRYSKPELKLLAVRDNVTGEYDVLSKSVLAETAGDNFSNLEANVRSWSDAEGVVVVFKNGHRIKLKADEYVLLHRTKEALEREINVVKCILEGTIDDLIGMCDEEVRPRLKTFVNLFEFEEKVLTGEMVSFCKRYHNYSQKEFAGLVFKKFPQYFTGLAFKMRKDNNWDLKAHETVRTYLRTRLIKQDRFDEIRDSFGGITWIY